MARQFKVDFTYHQMKVLKEHLREVRMVEVPVNHVKYLQEIEEKIAEKMESNSGAK